MGERYTRRTLARVERSLSSERSSPTPRQFGPMRRVATGAEITLSVALIASLVCLAQFTVSLSGSLRHASILPIAASRTGIASLRGGAAYLEPQNAAVGPLAIELEVKNHVLLAAPGAQRTVAGLPVVWQPPPFTEWVPGRAVGATVRLRWRFVVPANGVVYLGPTASFRLSTGDANISRPHFAVLYTTVKLSSPLLPIAAFSQSIRPGNVAYDCDGPQAASRSNLGAQLVPEKSLLLLQARRGSACVFAPFASTNSLVYLTFRYKSNKRGAAAFCIWNGASCAIRADLTRTGATWKEFRGVVAAPPGQDWLYLYAVATDGPAASRVVFSSIAVRGVSGLARNTPLLFGEG